MAGYDGGEAAAARLAEFGQAAVEQQCREWLSDPESTLRDKAFLISLAVFDRAPYVSPPSSRTSCSCTSSACSTPRSRRRSRCSGSPPRPGSRGPAPRGSARRGDRMGPGAAVHRVLPEGGHPRALLTEVWTDILGPARADRLAEELARDGRPVVRTRAAAATAMLALADLPSAVALLIDGWAVSKTFGPVSPPRTPSRSPSSSTRPSSCACSPSGARTPTRPAAGPRSARSGCSRRCARTWWPRP
ncbi:hypothetical protein O1M63_31070 [Streptomyces mirabilis]|nr:hypothetical protein [Streptomyces mirabilis]